MRKRNKQDTKLVATLLVYRAMGLKRFKVKVGGAEDIQRIRLIRRVLARNVELFADANVWQQFARSTYGNKGTDA